MFAWRVCVGCRSDGKTSFPGGISGPVSWVSLISTNDPGVRPPPPYPSASLPSSPSPDFGTCAPAPPSSASWAAPVPGLWYVGDCPGPPGPEGRLCDRGIWFLGICRQEGAGPAGRSLKSGILVGVGAALRRGSGSRILVSDILRFWNPESGNRDLESGNRDLESGNRDLETGDRIPSMESERAGLGASARGKA